MIDMGGKREEYEVDVTFEVRRTLTVWAVSDEDARDKAAEIVQDWNNVQQILQAEVV